MDGSNDARVPLLVELAWSGELLNRAGLGRLLAPSGEGREVDQRVA